MKPCYEGLKEIRVDVDKIWRKILGLRVSMGCYSLFWSSHKIKACYEGLKEIRVDVDEIWRKMLGFRVSIGLLPLLLIISENETYYEGLKEIGVDEIWRKRSGFRVSIKRRGNNPILTLKPNIFLHISSTSTLISFRPS